ncbi:hypothetical protein ACJQWY_01960 [Weissella kandleri]|uniref:hypothetical protein n=1 Tax=Weissella kandleri TaxID=1616 RepID=UPI00387E5609
MDKQKQEKPWEASFEETDAVKKYSRTENRRKSQRVSLVVGILVTCVLVLSFVPVYNYLKELNQPNQNAQTAISSLTNNQTKTSTSKVDGKSKSEKQAEAKAEKKRKAAEEKAASEKAASEAAAKSSQDEADSKTVLELPADRPTLFGFAAAHNISVEQLYNLNPGLTASNYTQWVGKEVKIK